MSYIAVVGPDDQDATDELCELAREVGRLLGQREVIVLTGGLGGVMAAVAEGCAESGGTSIGLLPGTGRGEGNAHQSLALPTGVGELRNGLLVRAADGVIVIGGSWGTLSELAFARRSGIPAVCLRGWQVLDADGVPLALDHVACPAAAVQRILQLAQST